jgi:hypothetical protein
MTRSFIDFSQNEKIGEKSNANQMWFI